MSSSRAYSVLKQEIYDTIQTYNEFLDSIATKKSNEINQTLWKIRAELETIIIEYKILANVGLLKEKWQEKLLQQNHH